MPRRTILFLHGGHQNRIVFEHATRRIRRDLEAAGFDCLVLEAGVRIEETPALKLWWPFPPPPNIFAALPDDSVVGAAVVSALLQIPADVEIVGVFGFSQGAKMAIAMAPHLPKLRALVLIAGFYCETPAHLAAQRHACTLPSLHIIGARDTLVPRALFDQLRLCFAASELLEHPAGHVVPEKAENRERMLAFLTKACSTRPMN